MPNNLISNMSKALPLPRALLLAASLLFAQPLLAADATVTGERWFQVEMTAFTHENSNLEMEIWTPAKLSLGFPERLLALRKLSDFLQLDDWTVLSGVVEPAPEPVTTPGISANSLPIPVVAASVLVGPRPYAPGESFRLPDFEREPFLALLEPDHDFTGSNRALSQSSAYRVLFHSAWRQPMTRRNRATAVAVSGGRIFNDRSELEGSVSLYFNNAEDRVIFDTNLWLSSFSTVASDEEGWALPVLPAVMMKRSDTASTNAEAEVEPIEYYVNRIMQLRQTRDMRSDEFHYIDHPAMGILVQITPYEVPEMPVPEVEETADPLLFQ